MILHRKQTTRNQPSQIIRLTPLLPTGYVLFLLFFLFFTVSLARSLSTRRPPTVPSRSSCKPGLLPGEAAADGRGGGQRREEQLQEHGQGGQASDRTLLGLPRPRGGPQAASLQVHVRLGLTCSTAVGYPIFKNTGLRASGKCNFGLAWKLGCCITRFRPTFSRFASFCVLEAEMYPDFGEFRSFRRIA